MDWRKRLLPIALLSLAVIIVALSVQPASEASSESTASQDTQVLSFEAPTGSSVVENLHRTDSVDPQQVRDSLGALSLAPQTEELFDQLESQDLEELVESACLSTTPNQGAALGTVAAASFNDLPDEFRASVELNEWLNIYGALVAVGCPDALIGADGTVAALSLSEVARFRNYVTNADVLSIDAKVALENIDDLQLLIITENSCVVLPTEPTASEFQASAAEQHEEFQRQSGASVSFEAFGSFFGALTGWFCPDKLPF